MKPNVTKLIIAVLILLIFAFPSWAGDLNVNDIAISSLTWGNQIAKAKVTNLDYAYKIVTVKTDIEYSGGSINPKRSRIKSFFLESINSSILQIPFEIPGNYGVLKVKLSFYEVVDTLDPLFESQIFHSKEYTSTFAAPSEMQVLLDRGFELPMFVDRTEIFDNQLTLALLTMIKEGKDLSEISQITGAESVYIDYLVETLSRKGLLRRSGQEVLLNFAVLDKDNIIALKPVIDDAIDKVFDQIKSNLPKYDNLLTTLASQGKFTRDKDNIMDPGSALYHKYPTILGLLLWRHLGVNFINNGISFDIFNKSNPCRADMGEFMYLVSGIKEKPGTFFYDLIDSDGERFYTSIGNLKLECAPVDISYGQIAGDYYWNFSGNNFPVLYSYDDTIIAQPLSVLADGADKIIAPFKEAVSEIIMEGNNRDKYRGALYWFWGQVVLGVIDKLEKNNLIIKEGNGFYNFQKSIE
jgi:hypothetical protein